MEMEPGRAGGRSAYKISGSASFAWIWTGSMEVGLSRDLKVSKSLFAKLSLSYFRLAGSPQRAMTIEQGSRGANRGI